MDIKAYAAGLCAVMIAGTTLAVPAAEAQTQTRKKQYVYTTTRVAPASRPRARVTVAPRSFLDAGTEVRPGDRKFTDYAFPPEYGYPSFARENNNRPIDRQPLNPPSDLGGEPTKFPLY